MARRSNATKKYMEQANEEFGYNFRSAFECKVAYQLRAGNIEFEYEPYMVDYYSPDRLGVCLDCNSTNTGSRRRYLVDFAIRWPGEPVIILETKGRLLSKDRTKYVNLIKSNPELDFRFLFESDNWLTKLKKKRYSQWATQKGFLSATGVTSTIWISQPKAGLMKSLEQRESS